MHSRVSRLVFVWLSVALVLSLIAACGKGRTNPPVDSGNPPVDSGNPPPPPDNNNPPPPPPDDTVNPLPDTVNPPPRDDPPPPPPKNTRCASLYECAKTSACGSPAALTCLDQCATDKKLEGEGLTRFTALKTCLTTHCGTCQDATCLKKCIQTNCSLERAKCASDEQTGANDCKATSTCMKNCQDDEVCIGTCAGQASPDGLATYAQVSVCDAKDAGSITPAEKKSCYGTALACDCPNDKAGQGAGTCADFITCLGPCGNDTCCVAKCRSQLTAATVSQADDFTICTVETCGTACPPNDKACVDKCVAEQCSVPYLACQCPGVGPPGKGSEKCGKGLQCIESCGANDVCCVAACTAKIRASSYPKYLAFIQCLPTCGCQQNDNACFKDCSEKGKCSSKAISCALD